MAGTLKQIDPARRLGQVGEAWGNLLMGPSDLALDEEFTFTGEETPLKVTRVLPYPLDASKRVFHYEKNPQR